MENILSTGLLDMIIQMICNGKINVQILSFCIQSCKAMKDERGIVEWSQLYAQTHQKKCVGSFDWTDDTVNNLLTTFSQLGNYTGYG